MLLVGVLKVAAHKHRIQSCKKNQQQIKPVLSEQFKDILLGKPLAELASWILSLAIFVR